MVGAMQALGYFASDPACGLPIGGGDWWVGRYYPSRLHERTMTE